MGSPENTDLLASHIVDTFGFVEVNISALAVLLEWYSVIALNPIFNPFTETGVIRKTRPAV
jgi:hypothetical protein